MAVSVMTHGECSSLFRTLEITGLKFEAWSELVGW